MAKIPDGLGDYNALMKRFTKAEGRWNLWRSLHQECFDYAAPERENFRFRSPGQRKNRHVFDATAVDGLVKFANRLEVSLVPPWQKWMSFVAGSDVPEEEKINVDQALEQQTAIFFDHLNQSNFDTEVTPTFTDLGIGTCGMLIEENPMADSTVLKFCNVPLSELYAERTAGGPVKNVWRKQKLEPRLIPETWPDADISPKLQKLIDSDSNTEVVIISGYLHTHEDGKYHQVVLYEADKTCLFAQSFDSQRLIVSRWHVMPSETYGRGPIMQVLPDIRTANKIKQFVLENAAIQMAGVYTGVSDGVFNPYTVRIAPGSIIPVTSNNTTNPTLTALPRAGDIGIGAITLEDLQNNIRKALLVDPLGDITDPVRTATENIIRNQEALKQQGASIGRQMSEFIAPLVKAVVDILKSRGKMANMRVDGQEISIKMQSPLAKAQDLEDFQNVQVWLNSMAMLPQEIVAGAVKIENIPEMTAEKLGVPLDLVRSDAERQQIGQALAAQAQMQQEAQPVEAA